MNTSHTVRPDPTDALWADEDHLDRLLLAMADGDYAAFEQLLPLAARIASALTRYEGGGGDGRHCTTMTHNALVGLWHAAPTYPPRRSRPRAWVSTTLLAQLRDGAGARSGLSQVQVLVLTLARHFGMDRHAISHELQTDQLRVDRALRDSLIHLRDGLVSCRSPAGGSP